MIRECWIARGASSCGIAALLMISLPFDSTAEVAQPQGVFDALKGIRQAVGSCRRDNEANPAAKEGPVAAPLLDADLSCAISPGDAMRWLEAANTIFVDTRPAPEHGQFGIRGAVNVRPSELKTKTYLQRKRIVLFGVGVGDQELYRACSGLKQAGFGQVHVLRGGLALWSAFRLPLIGAPPSGSLMSRLSAAQLWQESRYDDNVVVVFPSMSAGRENLPYSVLLMTPTAEGVRGVLERRRKELKGAPVASVILVAGAEMNDQQFEQLQQKLGAIPLLLYAESLGALDRQLSSQKAMWAAQSRGPKRPGCGL